MLNRRATRKKKAATKAAPVNFSLPDINEDVDLYVERESEKWLLYVIESGQSLYKGLWEFGKVKRDGTERERLLHKMVYLRFAQKAKALIGVAQENPAASE